MQTALAKIWILFTISISFMPCAPIRNTLETKNNKLLLHEDVPYILFHGNLILPKRVIDKY